jgi:hypothetical protein
MILLQLILFSIFGVGSLAILLPRQAIELAVPLSGNLSNTSTHYDPVTWTLYNPIFNQTTWEAQPYVSTPKYSNIRYQMDTLATAFQRREWDIGKHLKKQ